MLSSTKHDFCRVASFKTHWILKLKCVDCASTKYLLQQQTSTTTNDCYHFDSNSYLISRNLL